MCSLRLCSDIAFDVWELSFNILTPPQIELVWRLIAALVGGVKSLRLPVKTVAGD